MTSCQVPISALHIHLRGHFGELALSTLTGWSELLSLSVPLSRSLGGTGGPVLLSFAFSLCLQTLPRKTDFATQGALPVCKSCICVWGG